MAQYEILDILRKFKSCDYVSASYIKSKMKTNNTFRMIRSLEKAGFVVVKTILRKDGRMETVVALLKDLEEL